MMLLEKVLANVRRESLVSSGQKVVLAVSGGIDSVALAHIICALRQRLEIQLHVASLNHGIRGENAKEDLQFVARLSRQWRLPYTVGEADVPKIARLNRLGIEEAGRQARYSFLARVAAECGAHSVAVGHHALDQAETILMHIVRGSGLPGLSGMRFFSPMPGHPNVRLIRPLLNISRAELEHYCIEQGLSFRHDETNDNTELQRNFIRHRLLLPLLDRQPTLLMSFARLAESAAVDEDYLATQFEREVLSQVTVRANSWQVGKSLFEGLHPAMKRRLLLTAFKRLAADNAALDHDRTAEAVVFCTEHEVGKRRDLGAGIQLRIGYESLYLELIGAQAACEGIYLIPRETESELTAPMSLTQGDIRLDLRLGRHWATTETMLVLPAAVNMRLRTRRAGDRFRPKGMNGQSRKLKDWMIDRKIPRSIRDRIPILCADGEIVAVCSQGTWHLADLSHFDSAGDNVVTVFLK